MYSQGATLKYSFTVLFSLLLFATANARLVPVGLVFDSRVYRTPDARRCGDNFCNTWAGDDNIYLTVDDGNGWPDISGVNTELNHRVWRLKGGPESYSPEYLQDYPDYEWGRNWYAFGIVAVDGYIYYTISRPYKVDKRGIKLLYSPDYGHSWFRHDGVSAEKGKYVEDASTMFFWNEHMHLFSYCDFVQCGKDYQDAKDNYVYLYCKLTSPEPSIYVARVPRGHANIVSKSKYEYCKGHDNNGFPIWTPNIIQIKKVMSFPKEYYHSGFLPSVVYNKGLDLFIMMVGARPEDRFSGKPPILRLYWSRTPAGPWTEFHRDDDWRADSQENIPYQPKFMPKFTSADGKIMYMDYSDCSNRWKRHYVWNQQKITLTLEDDGTPTSAINGVP
ncbi:MAG: hypothetical protein ACYTEK_12825 [Planctomycetota bacterium]|jgi:hypothetical protein